MRELYVTKEMQKFQDSARRMYAENKIVNLDAIYIGWKIETGRVLYDAAQDATITLLDEPQKHLFKIHMTCESKGVDREAEVNITQIGSLILNNRVEVYYSK